MTLWLVLVVMAAVAAALVALPFLRARPEAAAPTDATEILKGELAQVEVDAAVGEIDEAAAAEARLEAQRRLLAVEAKPEPRVATSVQVDRVTAAAVVGAVVIGAVALYAVMGRPNTPSAPGQGGPAGTTLQSAGPAATGASPGLPDVDTMISRLEQRLQASPDDAEGWRMLGWSYFETQRYPKAVEAYGRAVKLQPTSAAFQSAYGEALAKAAGGEVTADARRAFQTALKLDPTDERARTYLGMKAAAGAPPTTGAGQTAAPADQQAMILGMVERQARKLADNPDDAEGWMMLIRSRMVLGQPELASKALKDALTAFRNDPATQKRLSEGAKALGVS